VRRSSIGSTGDSIANGLHYEPAPIETEMKIAATQLESIATLVEGTLVYSERIA
jgi:hypothetical protein